MSAYSDVAAALSKVGVRYTQWAWPTGKAPALPWCVIVMEDHGDVHADDRNYAALPQMRVELYQKEQDEELTASVRDALSEISPTSELFSWLDDEGCAMTTFTLTVPERKE